MQLLDMIDETLNMNNVLRPISSVGCVDGVQFSLSSHVAPTPEGRCLMQLLDMIDETLNMNNVLRPISSVGCVDGVQFSLSSHVAPTPEGCCLMQLLDMIDETLTFTFHSLSSALLAAWTGFNSLSMHPDCMNVRVHTQVYTVACMLSTSVAQNLCMIPA